MNTTITNSNFNINCYTTADQIINYFNSIGLLVLTSLSKKDVIKHTINVANIIENNIGGNVTLTVLD
jgi:hypothetical protein